MSVDLGEGATKNSCQLAGDLGLENSFGDEGAKFEQSAVENRVARLTENRGENDVHETLDHVLGRAFSGANAVLQTHKLQGTGFDEDENSVQKLKNEIFEARRGFADFEIDVVLVDLRFGRVNDGNEGNVYSDKTQGGEAFSGVVGVDAR